MASTHLSLHYHIIFGTKDRAPSILPAWRHQLHEYLGGVVRGLGGFPEGIGGVADHVHLLLSLKATHCIADFVRELKKASSAWVREHQDSATFAWQTGYAAFSVSATACTAVREYISNQEEHHRVNTFQEEYVSMLTKANIQYDPQYLD